MRMRLILWLARPLSVRDKFALECRLGDDVKAMLRTQFDGSEKAGN